MSTQGESIPMKVIFIGDNQQVPGVDLTPDTSTVVSVMVYPVERPHDLQDQAHRLTPPNDGTMESPQENCFDEEFETIHSAKIEANRIGQYLKQRRGTYEKSILVWIIVSNRSGADWLRVWAKEGGRRAPPTASTCCCSTCSSATTTPAGSATQERPRLNQ
jgi:hypothetical protein